MWFKFLIVAAVLYFLWKLMQPRYEFRIRVGESGIKIDGRIAATQKQEIRRFFSETYFTAATIRITARNDDFGNLRLKIRGDLGQGEIQVIRNFFLTVF